MSRIGKKPIILPDNVTIEINNDTINAKGALGSDSLLIPDGISLNIDNKILYVNKNGADNDKSLSALHGLSRALFANLITGVTKGFSKDLEIIGVGYRATQQNKDIVLQLGFSHNITFSPPVGVTIEVISQTKINIKGINKQKVGQVAADIRSLRPPEPYKGKGIRYVGEYVRKKAGKAGKK